MDPAEYSPKQNTRGNARVELQEKKVNQCLFIRFIDYIIYIQT